MTAFDKFGRPPSVGSYSGAAPRACGNTSPTSGLTTFSCDQTASGSNNIYNSVCDQQSACWDFVDGLGRLASVTEDPSWATRTASSTKVNAITRYLYDVLDNVTTVTQGSVNQQSFVFDSMKRVSAATSPEMGASSAAMSERRHPVHIRPDTSFTLFRE